MLEMGDETRNMRQAGDNRQEITDNRCCLRCGFVFLFSIFYFLFSIPPVFAQELSLDRIIVRFKKPEAMGYKISKMLNQGIDLESKLLLEDTFTFKVAPRQAEVVASNLEKDPNIKYAEPDYILHAFETPNDEYYPKQWALPKIEADKAWDLTHGSPQVKVAILDTGVSKSHPDLSAKVDQWVNFSSSSTEDDRFGHGTHTGGIVAAVTNNATGVAGTGYDVHLLSVKVLNDEGEGLTSWIANGIKWAADNGAKVINMSLGEYQYSQTLKDAVDYAFAKGVVVAASAGNESTSKPSYPASFENVIAVAATGPNDEKAYYSNYGSWVDVAAPGGNSRACQAQNDTDRCILSTIPGGYAPLQGTSMAAPFVSGLAGLIFSANPSLTASQVRSLIEENADKILGTGTYWTHGRINAHKSVLAAQGGVTGTPTPTVTPGGPTATPTPTAQVTPTVTPRPRPCPLSGDYNGDGAVNEADFQAWKTNFLAGQASLSCFEYWRRSVSFGTTP